MSHEVVLVTTTLLPILIVEEGGKMTIIITIEVIEKAIPLITGMIEIDYPPTTISTEMGEKEDTHQLLTEVEVEVTSIELEH